MMGAKVGDGWRGARDEFRSNARLRWGVACAAAIGFVYLCLVLGDVRRDLHEQYQQRTLQLYKMSALAEQEHWLMRARTAQVAEKALRAEIPSATTIGLAQAEVQTQMRQMIDAYSRRLTSDARAPAEVTGYPGLWRIPVTLRGVLSQRQVVSILRGLESSDRLIVVEEMSVTYAAGMPNMSLTLVAYYRIPESDKQGANRAAG